MPFRTRDFLLFLLAIVFLIIAGGTWSQNSKSLTAQEATLIYSLQDTVDEEVIYQAVLPDSKPDERSSRLQSLQGKIAQLFASDTLPEEVPETENIPESESVLSSVASEIMLCPSYSKANILWDSANIRFVVIEGARILYREVDNQISNDISSSTILQLPLNSFPSDKKTCLNNDIVGIALEGSLMRNDEDKIYKIFASETLLGYALDGFPIYGLDNNTATDSCGGASVLGSYRYYLKDGREGLIGCFSGLPISL